jgi:Nif-specific regulatory protein
VSQRRRRAESPRRSRPAAAGQNGAPRVPAADRDRLALLYELGCAFVARTELADLVPLVIEKCREVLRAEGAGVLVVDPATDELYFPYVSQEDPLVAERLSAIRVPPGQGIAGAVVASGKAMRIDDVAAHPQFYDGVDRTTRFVTRSMIAAPLVTPDGTIGVIEVVNRTGGPFSEEDLAFLETLALSIAVAIDNARHYSQLRDSAERLRDQVGALRRDLARSHRFTDIVGASAAIEEVFRLMESAASSPIAVLIEGETGTGKELVARGIHRASSRANGPFLAVNCAALPETLLESELFGHRRGAFTGATKDRRGLFEVAAGGTVFLDEVGEMPGAMQVKLLRVLQENEVVALGDSRPRRVDVRVISATNRDLAGEVAAGRFRDDLYFRLAAFPIRVPPLRQRREDIPALVDHFLSGAVARLGKAVRHAEPEAMDLLARFDWPGNVRELQNELERAVALAADGDSIRVEHLSSKLRAPRVPAASGTTAAEGARRRGGVATRPSVEPLRRAREAFEATYIARALDRHGGNVSRAARSLGLSRTMLHKKIRAYGLG